jgi:hypothetical protein
MSFPSVLHNQTTNLPSWVLSHHVDQGSTAIYTPLKRLFSFAFCCGYCQFMASLSKGRSECVKGW